MLSALRNNLPAVPRDLLPTIVDYATERPFGWSDAGLSAFPIRIRRNVIDTTVPSSQEWYRIVADRQIDLDGPQRWTIDCSLNGNGSAVGVGITIATAGVRSDGFSYHAAATADDVIVVSTIYGYAAGTISVVHNHNHLVINPSTFRKKRLLPAEVGSVLLVADVGRQALSIRFEDGYGQEQTVMLDLPESIRRRAESWRPCVAVCGLASATIRS